MMNNNYRIHSFTWSNNSSTGTVLIGAVDQNTAFNKAKQSLNHVDLVYDGAYLPDQPIIITTEQRPL